MKTSTKGRSKRNAKPRIPTGRKANSCENGSQKSDGYSSPQSGSLPTGQSASCNLFSDALKSCNFSRERVMTDICDDFVDAHCLSASPRAGSVDGPTSLACKEDQIQLNKSGFGAHEVHLKSERELVEAEILLAEDELRVRRRRLEYERSLRSLEPPSNERKTSPVCHQEDSAASKPSSSYIDNKRSEERMSDIVQNLQNSLKSLSLGVGLPRIEVEPFDGTPSRFWSFVKGLQTAVIDKLDDEGQKLSYLLYYCKGRAKAAIEHCVFLPKAEGYDQAMEILAAQFGKPHLIVQDITNEIFDGPKLMHNDVEGLRQLAIRMRGCEITLSQMRRTPELDCSVNLLRLVKRLPRNLQERWVDFAEKIIEDGREPCFRDLLSFVDRQVSRAISCYGQLVASSSRDNEIRCNYKLPTCRANAVEVGYPRACCPLCNDSHDLAQCEQFRASGPNERRKLASANKRCYLCLKANHLVANCRSRMRCEHPGCGRRHHSLLHINSEGADKAPAVSRCGATVACTKGTRLGYVPVRLKGPSGAIETYAFLDNGSDSTLISSNLGERLGLTGRPSKLITRTLHGSRVTSCTEVSLQLESLSGKYEACIDRALSIEKLPVSWVTDLIPGVIKRWSHLSDVSFDTIPHNEVGILLGCDIPDVHWVLDQRVGSRNEPFAVESVLGWVLRGPLCKDHFNNTVDINSFQTEDLLQHFQRTYELEFSESSTPDMRANSIEDEQAIELALGSIKHDDGHYEVGLPWRNLGRELTNNRGVAEQRLRMLKGRLERNAELKAKYDEILRDHERKGYVRQADLQAVSSKERWFLPHHYVLNPNKPGKVRVVFDCAAVYEGTSLNKALLQGPDLTNNLVGVLSRFRKYAVAMSADIQEMFLQVRVPDSDKWALSFLYWPKGDTRKMPIVYEMNVHPFGATSSPFCANLALQRTAEDNAHLFSASTVTAVKTNFYVDDCLVSVETEEEAISMAEELVKMLKLGGFHLTKWMTNSHQVMNSVLNTDGQKEIVDVDLQRVEYQRVLGLQWCITDDSFRFSLKLPEVAYTKRGILRCIASLYDPLGFVAPMLLPARKLMQYLSLQKLPWDTQVDDAIQRKWRDWLTNVSTLASFHINRCLMPSRPDAGTTQLHVFSDASEMGYGAVVYLRFMCHGKVHCQFLMGKSRVTPTKNTTIPRLELVAAVLAAKLYQFILRELQLEVDRAILWTDLTIVLQYVRNTSTRFVTFVANRVKMILERTSVTQWRHVPTAENPADVASRGASSIPSKEMTLWLSGPKFLYENEVNWPKGSVVNPLIAAEDPDVKEVFALVADRGTPSWVHQIASRYSGWLRFLKAIAWLRRFLNYFRAMKLSHAVTVSVGPMRTEEIKIARTIVVKLVQKQCFEHEYKCLRSNPDSSLPSASSLRRLRPRIANGILVLGGRVASSIDPTCNNLAILPPQSRITELIVQHHHEKQGHMGASYVLASIRREYWVIKGMATVRRILAKCRQCKLLYPRPLGQVIAPLPEGRVVSGKYPFDQCGVDYFGPFLVRVGRSDRKRYGCLFTCLQTRAIHLEVAHSMSADSFLMAFTRFVARRGKPSTMYSDNGSNFVAAESELREMLVKLDQKKLSYALARLEIDWRFQPPNASHRGGAWERMIRSTRRVLAAVSRHQPWSDEALLTYITEVERILNDRPLIPVYDDPSNPQVLCPNDLLLLRSNVGCSTGEVTLVERYTKGWRQAQYLASMFWKRWIREYLPTLQTHHKWQSVKKDIKVGDVVLVTDGKMPYGVWPKGVVLQVFPGCDGHVRQVLVKTQSGVFRRDIRSLSLLEGASSSQ